MEQHNSKKVETSQQQKGKNRLYAIVAILLLASILFRIINQYHFETTSILFIGLPALLAFLTIRYTNTPKNAYGVVFKVVTLFLLISAIFLGEGIACVIFMAPLFYGVGFLLTFIYQLFKKKNKMYSTIAIPILFIMAQPYEVKQTQPSTTITTSTIVQTSVSMHNFKASPNFLENYPTFFKLGFPKPIHIEGTGIGVGDTRAIQFKSNTKGIGTLELEIIEFSDNKMVFHPKSDDTHIDHWLTWERIEVELIPLNETETEVKWTTKYHCDLGPSWYFVPFEKIAVQTMNQHLTNAYFNH